MKVTLALAATMAASVIATPVANSWGKDPKGDWHKGNVKGTDNWWDNGKDEKDHNNGWNNEWNKGNSDGKGGDKKDDKDRKACDDSVFHFTSTYEVHATPDQVVNGTTPTGGLEGASGLYKLGLNSDENFICFDITLYNFRGEYQSAAATATHVHEAAKGASGPPRIAFPNPVEVSKDTRRSVGCLMGPFKTGIMADGVDTGAKFHVKQIEENPEGFFADVHSSLAVPGAVRGQIA